MKTTITPSSTVRAFVEFLQADEPRTSATHAKRVSAIHRFEEFLGRISLLRDLNDQTIEMFLQWPLAASFAIENLLQIGRAAAERDIIDWPMPTLPPAEHRNGNGLLGYFESEFLPARQESDSPLTAETIKAYRAAIRAYFRFKPTHGLGVYHISRRSIQAFRSWLLDRGVNPKKAGNHAFAVAAIVKHAYPERFVDDAITGDTTSDPTRTLVFVFENQYLPAKQSIASEKSIKKYTAVFQSFGRHIGRIATIDDLTDENVGAYMREIRRTGRSVRTVNGYRSKLLAIWSWCARKRLVDEFPTVEKMPEAVTLPVAWEVEELHRLILACDRMQGDIAGIAASAWWRTLHLVSWDTGERTGALRGLTWQMLSFKTAQLSVPAEFRKGGKKPMLYTLKPPTLRELLAIREPERELIFPYPKTTFYYEYKRLLRLAGLPYVRYKSALQKMRRSFATHLEAAGGNATDALSHALRSDTENSYLDPRMLHRTPPNELLFRLTDPKSA